MSCRLAIILGAVVHSLGCGSFARPPVATDAFSIGGNTHGLWNGADAVALNLRADDVDTLLTVPVNGPFTFSKEVADGASYVVTVDNSPMEHTCVVTSGANGSVRGADVTSIDVACTGPAVDIALSVPVAFSFDPTVSEQPVLDLSVLQQAVSVTVGGSITTATVQAAPVTLDQPSAVLPLALGSNAIAVAVEAGALSQTFTVVLDRGAAILEQAIYGKGSNTEAGDTFGLTVSVSGDTLVVGAYFEDSASRTEQGDNNADSSGAVYVFRRTGTMWMQEAYLKASTIEAGDRFGASVSVSGDRLAVGADAEDSDGSGQANNGAINSGAVYIFHRVGSVWTQEAFIKASNPSAIDFFGVVSLSGDFLVVGAHVEDGTGINVNPTANEGATDSGAAYVFRRNGTTWVQEAYLKASNTDPDDHFGISVSISGDTIVVGAPFEDGAGTGVGATDNNGATDAGAAYVYRRIGGVWMFDVKLKASNTNAGDFFGRGVAISGDVIVVGAPGEDSNAIGINAGAAGESNNGAAGAGAAYVFRRTAGVWAQEAYVKASNSEAGDGLGISVAISGDLFGAGAEGEDSVATGVDGAQTNGADDSGAVYVFRFATGAWAQAAYLKASNSEAGDFLGSGETLAISGDTLVVGTLVEASNATGIDAPGGQANNDAPRAGAVYVFR